MKLIFLTQLTTNYVMISELKSIFSNNGIPLKHFLMIQEHSLVANELCLTVATTHKLTVKQ